MKKKSSRKTEKQHMIEQFIEAWRSVLGAKHEKVEFVGLHRRRKRVKFLCDGQLEMVILGQHKSEELPDGAWMDPGEIDEAFADMFGVN